eukprot:CAMPEP_0178682100 /NCGR_PEP_ID=MMETSP0699-20121125/1591_1 /TAXON_ID=265572 /ORGANISM="Extubocellulus spinifer, Strain CCMP396" /LENGTH=47 /DNA_ID= /DNA_START= /DNA_END= /DNA_ORIENTATION=
MVKISEKISPYGTILLIVFQKKWDDTPHDETGRGKVDQTGQSHEAST